MKQILLMLALSISMIIIILIGIACLSKYLILTNNELVKTESNITNVIIIDEVKKTNESKVETIMDTNVKKDYMNDTFVQKYSTSIEYYFQSKYKYAETIDYIINSYKKELQGVTFYVDISIDNTDFVKDQIFIYYN